MIKKFLSEYLPKGKETSGFNYLKGVYYNISNEGYIMSFNLNGISFYNRRIHTGPIKIKGWVKFD